METEQDSGNAAHRSSHEEGQRDNPVHGDTHERRSLGVLGHGADRSADFRPVDEEIKAEEHQERGRNDEDRFDGHLDRHTEC